MFFSATFCFVASISIAGEKIRYVVEDDCVVYSGPSEKLYATNRLIKGAMVEVYHETKDGWSGIRPPSGSFDWVTADAGHLLPGGKSLQIIGRSTPAWIGTYEPMDQDALKWQIELQPTQTVSVIGEAIQEKKNTPHKTWFKIQPPAGEFRWIQSEKLVVKPIPRNELANNKSSNVISPDTSDTTDSEVIQAAATQKRVIRSTSRPTKAGRTTSQSVSLIGETKDLDTTEPMVDKLPSPIRTAPPNGSSQSLLGDENPMPGSEVLDGEIYLGEVPSEVNMEHEYADGNSYDGEIMDGEILDGEILDGEIIDGYVEDQHVMACCDSCGVSTGFNCGHQVDSFDHWDAMRNSENPKLRIHPVGRILGLIGLSITEAEVIQPEANCTTCGNGAPTMAYGASPPNPSPRFGERFHHLPRPGRRMRAAIGEAWSGNSPGWLGENSSSEVSSNSQLALKSPSVDVLKAKDWHSPSMARIEPPQMITNAPPALHGSLDSSMNGSMTSSPFGKSDIALVSNDDLDSLQFSTPEIQQAMLELSSIVSKPMEQWSLSDSILQAKNWIQNANDTIARGEARLLLDRIERFEGLRLRSMEANGMKASGSLISGLSSSAPISFAGFQRTVSTNETIGASSPAIPLDDTASRNIDGTPASDASGWLVEVFSQQPGQPEFALTDDAGGLIAYVVAAPGMNLRRYVKQPVGIYGTKGYLPNLSARQITAERIVRVR